MLSERGSHRKNRKQFLSKEKVEETTNLSLPDAYLKHVYMSR